MRRKIYLFAFVAFLFSSCAILNPSLEKKIAKVELGMSKKEVMNIVGKSYVVLSAATTPEGKKMESYLVKDSKSSDYILTFLDNELISFKQDRFETRDATDYHQPAKE